MSNELQIFNNAEFGAVRVVNLDGEPWMVGKDVAQALGYKDTVNALKAHVDDEDKARWQITTQFGQKETIVINESGLYSLVLSSKLPGAKRYRHWVTREVLPSIRKHGAYMTTETLQAALLNPDVMIRLCQNLKAEQEKNKALAAANQEMRPKAIFADAVTASKTSILVGELAKLLRQNGIDMGQQRLFAWLRENGYLIKRKGTDYNMPTQRSMELGLMEIKETCITHSSGNISVSKTPKITGKGTTYFVSKFLS